jgi:TPR repeat protein
MQAYVNYRGIGIPSNGKEAAFLLESLATQGFDICFVYLALMYDEGSPTLPQDSAKVKYYMEHARRGLGDRAQQVFDYQKNNFNGWALSPFDIHI